MGEPKAGMMLAGRPLIAYPIDAVRAAGLDPVVVAKPNIPLPDVGCPVIHDGDATTHPAAGVLAALTAGDGAPLVVIACDMPFVEPKLIGFLAGLDAGAAVPRVRGRLEPLLARYSKDAIPVLESAIARGRALHEAIEALDPLIVEEAELARFGEPERMAQNVNDGAELAAAERLLATGATR
jgi:molybdopterin-guanine dinucleotide biosynthesis protein A